MRFSGYPLLEAITGRDEFGRPQNLQGQLKDVAKRIMPIPLQALTRPGDYDIKESAAKGMGITAHVIAHAPLAPRTNWY